ncbi:MAG: DinB family protein [Candidatus Dojkabacteria bacterium]|nr:MAG: DinB family protein [Candidatus Dojkabacteria bacterium]
MNKTIVLETLSWQYSLTWRLAEYTLQDLTDEECLWEPTKNSWNVRKDAEGRWVPDWIVPEPVPIPTTSIAWVTWHIMWWWSSASAVLRGDQKLEHNEVFWPGSASRIAEVLQQLNTEWLSQLEKMTEEKLDTLVAHPWSEPRPLRIMIAWVNSELMKNVSEIGYVRHLWGNRE